VHAMSIDLDNWLAVEQMMEEENHILLQPGTPETETQQQPQLLVISSYAANGSSSPVTFSLIVLVGGKRGLASVDNGNTDTFLDYIFARKINCGVVSTASKRVKVA
jgi:hypothetical protein